MNTRLLIVRYAIFCAGFLPALKLCGQNDVRAKPEQQFDNPPVTASPWVFWYWMQGAVSNTGITADLEAMQLAGIGGACLVPVKDTSAAIPVQPAVMQLSPEWWGMVHFAMQEANRLHLQLAMRVSDGFALVGSPWITPEKSMQQLVWTKEYLKGGTGKEPLLEQPLTVQNYYKDIAVFAYPANSVQAFSDTTQVPTVSTSTGARASFLCFDIEGKQSFKSDTACWIQYHYHHPFTVRSIRIITPGNNYQVQRLLVQASNDGLHFNTITRLQPPVHGWQDTGQDYTSAIPVTTAKYFRFVYDKKGPEPGARDLGTVKGKPGLKINHIWLSDEPVIHQYEAKNGSVWCIAAATTAQQVTDKDAVPLKSIINLTDKMDSAGNLHWQAPAGNWVVVRIGHTSTGPANATNGAASGLECDKFDPAAITLQFNNWFAKAFSQTDKQLARRVLKIFHTGSWECGRQNWSTVFPAAFSKRNGYDLMPWLLAMTGVPVETADRSEKFLLDVRNTIAALVNDKFSATLKKLARKKGCRFIAASVTPTMLSDDQRYYKNTGTLHENAESLPAAEVHGSRR